MVLAAGGLLILLFCVAAGALGLLTQLGIPGLDLQIGKPAEGTATGTVTERIGHTGGEIAGPGEVKVIVPEGTFDEEVEISIVEVPSAQGAPPDTAQLGPAYNLTLPEDTEFHKALDIVLPLEREAGTSDEQYTVYRWNGSEWQFLGGIIEGDTIRIQISHHTFANPSASAARGRSVAPADATQKSGPWFATFREISTGRYRTIAFVNHGEFHPWVLAWTWEPVEEGTRRERWLPAYGGWYVAKPTDIHYYPNTWAWLRLPLGTYTSWCLEWWDDEEKDFFHFLLPATVTLDVNTPTLTDHLNRRGRIPQVDYTLSRGMGTRGMCGYPPGEGAPVPTATPPPLGTPTPVPTPSTGTPTLTLVPTLSLTPTPSPTPTPSTPTPSPTPTPSTPTPSPTPRPEVKLGEERRSEHGGYSFREIPGYTIEDVFGFDTMMAPDADPDVGPLITMVGGISEREGTTAQDMYDAFVADQKEGVVISPPREVIVDGIAGLEADLSGSAKGEPFAGRVVFVAVSDGQFFTMLGLAPSDRWESELEPLFEAVRASVRFFTLADS